MVDGLTGVRSLHVNELAKPMSRPLRTMPTNDPCPFCLLIAGDDDREVFWKKGPWWCVANRWNPVEGHGTGELLVFERHVESLEECGSEALGELVDALWSHQKPEAVQCFRFTNVGSLAGASQSHLHTQRVSVDFLGGHSPLGEREWREDLSNAERADTVVVEAPAYSAYVAPAPQFYGEVRIISETPEGLGHGVGEMVQILGAAPVAYNVLWHRRGALFGAQVVMSSLASLYGQMAGVTMVRSPVDQWAEQMRQRRRDGFVP